MVINEALSLMLVSSAAAMLPGVSRLLRIPAPVAEIVFGIILGKSVLHLQFSGAWLQFLAHLGFLLLMFHAGMEIDFAMLRKQSWKHLFFQSILFGATLGLSFLSALLLGRGLFLTLILTTTSLSIVVPTLKGAGVIKTTFGQSILLATLIADFLSLLGVTFFVLWRHYGIGWQFVYPLPLFVGFAIVLWAGRLWAWWNPGNAESLLGAEDSSETGVRLSMALLFFFVAASQMVGMEPVLGAFMGGCTISFVFREKGQLEQKLSALGYGFLIPIFFINIGMQLELTHVSEAGQIYFAMQLLGLAFLVKVLPSLLFTLQDLPLRSALGAGFLMTGNKSLVVAAASIGVQAGLITPQIKDTIVLLAISTCLLSPTLFRLTYGAGEKKEPELERD
jgi:Kef-type K+ transport system membrane component KefB